MYFSYFLIVFFEQRIIRFFSQSWGLCGAGPDRGAMDDGAPSAEPSAAFALDFGRSQLVSRRGSCVRCIVVYLVVVVTGSSLSLKFPL